MNRAPSAESLAHVTAFERFLILNKGKLMLASLLVPFIVSAVISLAIVSTPVGVGHHRAHQSYRVQLSHAIGLALYSYANDHDQKYPVGNSSTEIFQQLIDQQYVTDPSIFYFEMPGKTKATTNKLKPENVCFDMTNAVQPDDPDTLPLLFSTGFKIDYIKGGKAHLLKNGDPNGIAVFFKNNSAEFLGAWTKGDIHLFPPVNYDGSDNGPAFDPKGRTYQQLTPDGPLP